MTVGQLIDAHLHEMADQGKEVRHVQFAFAEEAGRSTAHNTHPSPR